MTELMIQNSNLICYKVVTDSTGKKYLMDVSTVTPSYYGFGILTNQVRIEMVEIDKNNQNYDQKSLQPGRIEGITAASQLFTKVILDFLSGFVQKNNVQQEMILKLAMYIFSFVFAYLGTKFVINYSRKKVSNEIPRQATKYIAVFNSVKKRQFGYYFFIALNALLFYFYMTSSLDVSGSILILNSMVALVLFLSWLAMFPMDTLYKHKYFTLESIEEIA